MMADTLTTHHGELVTAHVGPIHLDRTEHGVEVTLVGAITPTALLTPAQVRRLHHVLGTFR
jgi:hypothetical protein